MHVHLLLKLFYLLRQLDFRLGRRLLAFFLNACQFIFQPVDHFELLGHLLIQGDGLFL